MAVKIGLAGMILVADWFFPYMYSPYKNDEMNVLTIDGYVSVIMVDIGNTCSEVYLE